MPHVFPNQRQPVLDATLGRRTLLRGAAGSSAATLLAGLPGPQHATAQSTTPAATPGAPRTEILWDTWGVPHIFADDAAGLFYGFGWAQAHNHGNLLLQLYAQARGRGAEVYGERLLVSDRAMRTMGIPERGAIWYDAQRPEFRANIDAFAAGINAYAERHPDRLDEAGRAVLPVTGTDVCAHLSRTLYLFLAGASGILGVHPAGTLLGSNAWAIAPAATENGHALLLNNPHLLWSDEHIFIEAQLQAPGVYDAYGAALVGIPVLVMAFNDHLGWTSTVNTLDAGDLYELAVAGDGYRFDGEVRPFETRTETIRIRQEDGSMQEESLTVRRSVHGPVVEAGGATFGIRMVAIDEWSSAAGIAEQWWDMARAATHAEFEDVLRRLDLPFFHIIYADGEGHIQLLFSGHVPVRPAGDFDWSGPVPGDTSTTLWTEIHAYDDLPNVVDPPGGWVQNSNSPPWLAALPAVLDPDDYPVDMAPQFLHFREQRGIRMLEENPRLTLERMIELKNDTRLELADHVVDELVAAARQSGDELASQAADVLAAWDRRAEPDSTGTLLFFFWVFSLEPTNIELLPDLFSVPWDAADPLNTPRGLANPDQAVEALRAAAEQVQGLFGRLDVPWGEVARLRRGEVDLPANGMYGDPFGCFRVLNFDFSTLPTTGQGTTIAGDTYVAAIEFSDPVRAMVLMTYGNATQPGSPHIGDQLELSAHGELRPAWRSRAEIEANLEARDVLS
jgi:acyl-homoserine-lactone acylase